MPSAARRNKTATPSRSVAFVVRGHRECGGRCRGALAGPGVRAGALRTKGVNDACTNGRGDDGRLCRSSRWRLRFFFVTGGFLEAVPLRPLVLRPPPPTPLRRASLAPACHYPAALRWNGHKARSRVCQRGGNGGGGDDRWRCRCSRRVGSYPLKALRCASLCFVFPESCVAVRARRH